MGSYLSQPVTEKESSSGGGRSHKWGCSSMQGWRTTMEDAHIALSELQDEMQNLSLFSIFDGHGGAEVAAFCQEQLPDELRRHFRRQLADGRRPSGESLGEALIAGFHAMDDMLRLPEYEQKLLALKQAARPGCRGARGTASSSASSSSSGSSDSGEADEDEEAEDGVHERKPKVVSMLNASIQSDLEQARDKGSLSKDEAKQVMMKMALLRRLQSRAPSFYSEGGIADNVGCTAVCVLLTDTEIVCANAGDSRAVLCRGGHPVELSHDHKPNDVGERQRIEAAGGRVEEIPVGTRVHYRVNGNLNLSRAIGDMEYKKKPELGHEKQMICSTPDIIRVPLTKEDEFLILACDGVWDVKSNSEACNFVGKRLAAGEAISKVVEALLDDCIAEDPKKAHGLGGDNMTCIVVQLHKQQSS
eukprot:TRINITY_DN39064_c0_g1_i1.p1 TRINITY_DN39064_c0_g1~~TRINITY_DN39064_c0_g1_i1.p1  ORF type:complete len:430 (-),score=112.35 TRINITY_DN39064_c0_g1_i1:77-1327(-)